MMNKLTGTALLASLTIFACASNGPVGEGDNSLGGNGNNGGTPRPGASQGGSSGNASSSSGGSSSSSSGGSSSSSSGSSGTTSSSGSSGRSSSGSSGTTSSSGSSGQVEENVAIGGFLITQGDHELTQLLSIASRGTSSYTPGTNFGDCHLRTTATGNMVPLNPPKDFVFQGGNAISPLALLPNYPNDPSLALRYGDNRNLNVGGSPTWLLGGETLSAQSAATADVPAINFPALAWPSRASLASSNTFQVTGGAGARYGSDVVLGADIDIAWTVEDAVAGSVSLNISRQDNTVAVDCTVPVSAGKATLSAAAIATLGTGPAYIFLSTFNHADVPVAGFTAYHYTLQQREAGRSIGIGGLDPEVRFTIR